METQLRLSEARHLDMLKRLTFAKPSHKSNNVSGAEDSLLMSEKKTFHKASVAKQQS